VIKLESSEVNYQALVFGTLLVINIAYGQDNTNKRTTI